jgi:hypothetical protein
MNPAPTGYRTTTNINNCFNCGRRKTVGNVTCCNRDRDAPSEPLTADGQIWVQNHTADKLHLCDLHIFSRMVITRGSGG